MKKKRQTWECLLSLIGRKTKWKCAGVILLALAGSVLASLWPVQLGKLYTRISSGELTSIAKGIAPVATSGLIYLAAE